MRNILANCLKMRLMWKVNVGACSIAGEGERRESDKKKKCILWKGSLQKSSIQHFREIFDYFFLKKIHFLFFFFSAPAAINDFVWLSLYFAINALTLHGLNRKRDPSLQFKVYKFKVYIYNLIQWNMENSQWNGASVFTGSFFTFLTENN